MKITILNKNRINNTGSWQLSNLNSYEIDEGFTYTKCFNKTLDSATIRLSHLSSKIDIEPLDEVLLNDDSRFDNIYMCVENYTCIEECLDENNITYTYEIALLSQIKRLEGILLPNLSITPLRENKRSVGFYLRQYLNEYGEKIRYDRPMELLPNENEQVFDNAYNFSQELLDRFDNVVCPELQWNEPTLREVIDDLLMVDNCIATLNNGVISYLDLEQTTGNEITNYNYVRESQAIDDYVSDIKMTMQNGLQNDIDDIKNVVSTTEYLHISTPDGYRITTNNFELQTNYPILNIKHLYLTIPLTDYHNETSLITIDLVDNLGIVSEYQEHITKNVLYSYQQISWNDAKNYQNCCLYFNRGGNIITGFHQDYRKSWLSNYTSYELMLQVIGDYIQTYGIIDTPSDFIQAIDDLTPSLMLFKIEYETTSQQVFSAGKTDIQTNYRQIKDNQTNSWVNVNTQGRLEYSKADRLGNKSVLINQRSLDGDVITIGDTKGDYVVYEATYGIYKDHIDTNARAVKHYILKDFFTGVNSKIRTWVNAQNEAFEKNSLIKYIVELGTKKRVEYGESTGNRLVFNNYPINYFYSPLKTDGTGVEQYAIPPLKNAMIKFYDENGIIALQNDNTKYLLRELNTKIIGKSIVFSVKFENNSYTTNIGNFGTIQTYYSQGSSQPKTNMGLDGGYTQPIIKYINDNYEYTKIVLSYINNDKTILWDKTDLTSNQLTTMYQELAQLPLVASDFATADGTYPQFNNEWLRFSIEYINRKDNKEIPNYALQFEFNSESRDLYLTDYFMTYQSCVSLPNYVGNNKQIYLGTYEYGKTEIGSSDTLDSGASYTISSDGKVEINLSLEKQNRAIYIAINNKILIGLKDTNTFYINILKNRNKTIYNSNRVKIGEL